MPLLVDILSFVVPCWAVNVLLNGLYVLKKHLPAVARFDRPLDGRVMLAGHRLLGDSTTLLGLCIAVVAGVLLSFATSFSLVLSLLVSLGVYLGHALGSFIKRRLGYADGQFMPVMDHADSVLIAGVACAAFGYYSWATVLCATFITIVFQPGWNYVWYRLGFRRFPL